MTSSLLMPFFSKCFLFLLIFGCHLTNGREDLFCEQLDDQLDSSFMLDGNTFFKIKEKIWIMPATRFNDVSQLNDTETALAADPYKYTHRVENFEHTIKSETDIDITEPIWGFDYRFPYNVCKSDDHPNWCQMHSFKSNHTFVCLYGHNKTKPFSLTNAALSLNGFTLKPIPKKDLKEKVSAFCERQISFVFEYFKEEFNLCDNNSFIGWNIQQKNDEKLSQHYVCKVLEPVNSEFDWVIILNYTTTPNSDDMHRPHDKYENEPKIFDRWDWKHMRGITPNKIKLVIPMRFRKGVTIVFNCMPHKCHIWDQLDNQLFGYYNSIDPNTQKPYYVSLKGLSIKNILRCPDREPDDDPKTNDFCQQEGQQLDSSFMLDDNTFFKIRDRIWDMYGTKHNDVIQLTNPDILVAVKPSNYIRRDKDLESIIKFQTDIDITQPIWAFNYRYFYNVCKEEDKPLDICRSHSLNSKNSFVCLYGRNKTNPFNLTYVVLSFDGERNLQPLTNKELEKEVSIFCDRQTMFEYKWFKHMLKECDGHSFIGWNTQKANSEELTQHYVCKVVEPIEDWPQYDYVNILHYNTNPKTGNIYRHPDNFEDEPQIFRRNEWKFRGIIKERVKLVIPMRFANNVTIVFNCFPNECSLSDHLDDHLFGFYNSKDPKTDKPYKFHVSGLSLKKILICPDNDQIDEEIPSKEKSDEICDQRDNPIDSSFMLRGDTFFKIRQKIWGMSSTQFNEPMHLRNKVLKDPWNTTRRMTHIENSIRYLTDINIYQPIWAFEYWFYYNLCSESDYPNICIQHGPGSSNSYVCVYGWSERKSHHSTPVVRMYSALSYDGVIMKNIGKIEVEKAVLSFCYDQIEFLYKYYKDYFWCDQNNLSGWTNTTSYQMEIYFYCKMSPSSPKHDSSFPYDVVFPLTYKLDPSLPQNLNGTQLKKEPYDHDRAIEIWRRKTQFIIPISFIGAGILVNCAPSLCYIWNKLDVDTFRGWNSIDPKTGQWYKPVVDLSIAKLLRCPNDMFYQKVTFDPNHFCHQKWFDSIFSLGDDIYFQSNSKFWRYYALSSTNESIPEYKRNVLNVRYDSYTTTLLRQFFDTSRTVSGFSLRPLAGCDIYGDPKKYRDCPIGIETAKRHRLTCLYGFNRTDHYNGYPFFNTPAGLEVYPKNNSQYSKAADRCYEIIKRHLDYNEDAVNRPWLLVPETMRSVASSTTDFKIIENTDVPNRAFDVFLEYTVLLTTYVKKDKYYLKSLIHNFLDLEDGHLSSKDIQESPKVPKEEEFDGIFFHKPRGQWIAFQRDENTSKISSVASHLRWGVLYDFKFSSGSPFSDSIAELMNCSLEKRVTLEKRPVKGHLPFMSYSLVVKRDPRKWICLPYYEDNKMVEFSIFNIGEYVYFQIEQRFYRYDREKTHKQRFIYDKQVSELLNDLFDTTKRVIGYSYKYIPDKSFRDQTKYRVVIMGRPQLHYFERLSNETHKRRVMYRIFEKHIGPLAPLVPINHLPTKRVNYKLMKNPFGFVENFCEESSPSHKCAPFSIEAETNTTILNAIAYLQYENLTYVEGRLTTVHEDDFNLYPTFLSFIENSTSFHATDIAEELFVDPLHTNRFRLALETRHWYYDEPEWKTRASKRFYGMFSSNNTLYIVGRGMGVRDRPDYPGLQAPKIFKASRMFLHDQEHHIFKPFYWDKILLDNYITTLDKFFECELGTEIPSSREQWFSRNGAMILLFVFLAILLIVILIVLAIMAFIKYGSHKQKSETKVNKTKSEAMSSEAIRNEDANE